MLAYDAACLRYGRPPAAFAAIGQPGAGCDGGGEFVEQAGGALAASLPHAERLVISVRAS